MSGVKLWCLGFMFSSDLRQVLLIKKTRTLHIGKLNGVGGTIEQEYETPRSAMVRECREETGYVSHEGNWIEVGFLCGIGWKVIVYALVMPEGTDSFPSVPTSDDAAPLKHPLITIADLNLAPHTGMLVFAALEKVKNPATCEIYIQEL